MIKHYFKHAFKFILRDKFHSFLNIIGLAIGITVSIITLLFVQNELNYNGHHKKADRIYMYGVQMTIGDRTSAQSVRSKNTVTLIRVFVLHRNFIITDTNYMEYVLYRVYLKALTLARHLFMTFIT